MQRPSRRDSCPFTGKIADQSTPANRAPQPLSCLRAVDVGNLLAAPYAATVVGEFGAELFKVEHPDGGDPMRRFGTATERPRRDDETG